MLLGAIADDFTGASDLANTLARGGMAVTAARRRAAEERHRPPWRPASSASRRARSHRRRPSGCRSQALAWLREQGCRQYLFKYCSTFDSTPSGNIGPVAEALSEALSARGRRRLPGLPDQWPHGLSGSSLRQGSAAFRKRHGAPSAEPDDRSRHPPLARAADHHRHRPRPL